MSEVNTEYSGSLQEGWNMNGTYSRLQYFSSEVIDINSFLDIIDKGLYLIKDTDNTRLDIRTIISDDFDIVYILNKFPNSDISIKMIGEKQGIIFGLNIGDRILSNENLLSLKNYINNKVDCILNTIEGNGGFEKYIINILNIAINRGFKFENKNFSLEEVYKLWGYNFGWTKESIGNFIKSKNGNDVMFGLRNNSGILIALLMIGDDFETTEWAVLEEYQGTGVIEPLLIAVNGLFVENGKGNNIYAHMRWNRSIGPGLKSGLRVNNKHGINNILTNLVEVEGKMEHFLEGTLDTSLYNENILNQIKNFRN